MVPEFKETGLLPEGIHAVSLEEATEHFGWNRHRQGLIDGLLEALKLLKTAGVRRVYLNGSFVTAKERPGDIDVLWDADGVDVDRLDPVFLNFDNERAAQKSRFGCEFFPAQMTEGRSGKTFLEFFQVDKATGMRKGLVEVPLDGDP